MTPKGRQVMGAPVCSWAPASRLKPLWGPRPGRGPYLLPVCDKARILLCALSFTKKHAQSKWNCAPQSPDGALRAAAPRLPDGRCYAAASNFRCACSAAVRPSQLQPLDMSVDDVGPSRRDPLRASSRFWTANLLMSESGTSTRPFPSPLSPLSSHQPRLDRPRPPSRRGASLPHSAPKAQQHGCGQIYFAPASRYPSTCAPCPCNLPCDPSARWIPHSFPCRARLTSQCQPPRGACFPKHPVAPSTPPQHPRQPCKGGGPDHSPYRNGARGGAAGSITLDPSNLIL